MSPETPEFDTGLCMQDLDPERPRAILTPWGTMALFVIGDEVSALQAFCPHLEAPLFQGSVANGAVTCPWHRWRFDLRSGACLGRGEGRPPAREDDLARSEVRRSSRGTLVLARPHKPVRRLA
jgi:nitrite reductase/ring-hydroxylating ferredoxin subunit